MQFNTHNLGVMQGDDPITCGFGELNAEKTDIYPQSCFLLIIYTS